MIRRLIDIVIGFCGLVVGAPLTLLVGLCVWGMIGRPVFFTQTRVGKESRVFRLIKFRTMTNARDDRGELLSDLQRTPAFGRFIRRTRLDELPELWNILAGHMSLIGPRPLLPTSFETQGDAGRKRAEVRPGLTGWAQVNGNTLLSQEEKLALDVWYVEHASLGLDLKILAKTVVMLLFGERIDQSELRRARESVSCRRG